MEALPFLLRHRGLLRLLTFGSFIPALPMCLTHGFLSDNIFPAVGLLPLLFSSASGIFLHRHGVQKQKVLQESRRSSEAASSAEASSSQRGYIEEGIHEIDTLRGKFTHPFTVFVFDVIMSFALLIILIYTWRSSTRSAMLGMLAAYATIPLILSCFSHFTLAAAELYHGFAIHGFTKWVASKAADSHCPKCKHPIQPEMPEVPWYKLFKGWGRRGVTRNSAPLLTDGSSSPLDATERSEPLPIQSPKPLEVKVKRFARSGDYHVGEPVSERTALLK